MDDLWVDDLSSFPSTQGRDKQTVGGRTRRTYVLVSCYSNERCTSTSRPPTAISPPAWVDGHIEHTFAVVNCYDYITARSATTTTTTTTGDSGYG